MKLSKLEQDLIEDLAADTHGIWEVFEFARLHNRGATDSEVHAIGCDLLRSWIARGWIEIAKRPLAPTNITEFDAALARIDELQGDATRYWEGAPSIDLTEKAVTDHPWLADIYN